MHVYTSPDEGRRSFKVNQSRKQILPESAATPPIHMIYKMIAKFVDKVMGIW